jgi:hypothetical protein
MICLMLSLSVCANVITLSGFHCIFFNVTRMIKFQKRIKKNNILLEVRNQYDSEVMTSLKNERLRVASEVRIEFYTNRRTPTDGRKCISQISKK